jgi:hypothetical protein
MKELLRRLGIDASKSDTWQRRFFRHANLHYGGGHAEMFKQLDTPLVTKVQQPLWTPRRRRSGSSPTAPMSSCR